MAKARVELDIEKLLHWAYRDELSKRGLSSAEGIWDRIDEIGQRGGVDPGHGAAQRYAHFGLPHADAETIERAVGRLEDVVIDWNQSLDFIAGDLCALVSVNDFARGGNAKLRSTIAEWTDEKGRRQRHQSRPRDVILVGAQRTSALVTMHAVKATRPGLDDEQPTPNMVMATKGPYPQVVGTCEGKNRYSAGAHCLLQWLPSPLSIVMARAEYVAWLDGLERLAASLELTDFVALPPRASKAPWLEDQSVKYHGDQIDLPTGRLPTLPLAPERGRMGPPLRRPQAGPVRYPLRA